MLSTNPFCFEVSCCAASCTSSRTFGRPLGMPLVAHISATSEWINRTHGFASVNRHSYHVDLLGAFADMHATPPTTRLPVFATQTTHPPHTRNTPDRLAAPLTRSRRGRGGRPRPRRGRATGVTALPSPRASEHIHPVSWELPWRQHRNPSNSRNDPDAALEATDGRRVQQDGPGYQRSPEALPDLRSFLPSVPPRVSGKRARPC